MAHFLDYSADNAATYLGHDYACCVAGVIVSRLSHSNERLSGFDVMGGTKYTQVAYCGCSEPSPAMLVCPTGVVELQYTLPPLDFSKQHVSDTYVTKARNPWQEPLLRAHA